MGRCAGKPFCKSQVLSKETDMSRQVFDEEFEQEGSGPNWTLLVVAYFALLAVVIVILRPLHLSMGGIFFVMVGAAVALALIILGTKWVIHKFATMNLTVKDAYHL